MENEKIFFGDFRDLRVWQHAHILSVKMIQFLYKINDPKKYALCDQLRRSVISIELNISEGNGRRTLKDKNRFYIISRGSINETKNLVLLFKDLEFMPIEYYQECLNDLENISKMLNGLIRN
jgi:four helix bundle protein